MKKERTPRNGEEKNSKGWRRKKLQGMKKKALHGMEKERTPGMERKMTPKNGEGKDSNIRERATNVGWNWSTVVARRLSKLVML